jgi:general secretion pathway protein E/type IV pilus assembly protein PilB
MSATDEYLLQVIEERGMVTEDQYSAASDAAIEADSEENLATLSIQYLRDNQLIDMSQLLQVMGEELNMEVVDLSHYATDPEALSTVTKEQALKYRVLPLSLDGGDLLLAVSDPVNFDAIDSLSHVLQIAINPVIADPVAIDKRIRNDYEITEESKMDGFLHDMDALEIQGIGDINSASEEDAPIIKYVQLLISEAIRRRTSDIHLEPMEKEFRVRYRIDGSLHKMESPPKRLQPAILSRLKLMADISIAEKRIPQDGRISIVVGNKDIDLRVSTLPTVYGESIVMRILDKENLALGLPQLGFFTDDQTDFEKIIQSPDGIFLVTGPTGSGKSTTLYTALNYINKPDRKIITVEDPVEYQLTGINQVSVLKEVGMTFSAALRSMLRQAPNIIMVGEIRDKETAEIAVNASLTGHMVFSTLHTNDAASAVTRLIDIGVKPFLVAAALRAALAQRLVRNNCLTCKAPYIPEQKELDALGIREDQVADANFMKGPGCDNCNGNGYRGRIGVFEIFKVNNEIEQMIYEGRSIVDLRRKSRDLGMRTMREDGMRKVLAGVTTPNEVLVTTVASEE